MVAPATTDVAWIVDTPATQGVAAKVVLTLGRDMTLATTADRPLSQVTEFVVV